jgi:hypothetical protein
VNLGRKRLGLSAQQQYEFNVTDANAVTTLFVQSFGIGQDRKREDFGWHAFIWPPKVYVKFWISRARY